MSLSLTHTPWTLSSGAMKLYTQSRDFQKPELFKSAPLPSVLDQYQEKNSRAIEERVFANEMESDHVHDWLNDIDTLVVGICAIHVRDDVPSSGNGYRGWRAIGSCSILSL